MQRLRQFQHEGFQDAFDAVLGAAYHRAADVGEVLATAARVQDGDADSWLREWTATAGGAWVAAGRAERAGHRASALEHHLRAGTYYAAALRHVALTDQSVNELDLWRRQRECWDRAVALFPVPGEHIAIPYERTSLPGYYFCAPGARPGEPRPLVVLNNGSDTVTSDMLLRGGAAAAIRGYHWMTFDGPGQQAALYRQGLRFRPDWAAVLTPVFDAMAARTDVDAERIAVIGVGQAGFWVPRALAFEHRFAAAVADPGVVDVATSWTATVPQVMREALIRGERERFDREMHLAQLFAPETKTLLEARAAPYGGLNGSAYDLFTRVASYRLGDEVEQIVTPLLITSSTAERRWPGQSRTLFEHLPGPRHLVEFSAAEGADGQGEPLAPALRETRIFDWLDGRLRAASSSASDARTGRGSCCRGSASPREPPSAT